MADTKISALTDGTTANATDRLAVARDPTGTPLSRYVTPAYIRTYMLSLATTWTAQHTFAAGTITTSQPTSITQTWNDSGVTFTGFNINITDTASAAASLAFTFQLAGVTQTSITKAGRLRQHYAYDVNKTFIGDSSGGLCFSSGGTFAIANGTCHMSIGGSGLTMRGATPFGWFSGNADAGAPDAGWIRDGAGILGQRVGTTAQAYRVYDTFTSSTDYHRLGIATARATLSGVTGASVTATSLIPDGAVVVGVTTKVTTGLGTGNGTTGYTVGDGTDVDRWGAIVGTASGTSSDNTNWTAGTIEAFTSATNVVITASGGNFDGTGVIHVTVFYLRGEAD